MSTLIAPSKSAKTAQLLTENWLRNVFSSDLYTVRGRGPLAEDDAEHNPAVVVTHAHEHEGEPPVLVVEVSDAPVSEETVEKASQYAAAGVRDYWVIEVGARRVHTYRDPQPDPDAKHGHSYKRVSVNSQFGLVAPLAAEIHLAQVANLLPW
jgi:Uma2 family endonuclease